MTGNTPLFAVHVKPLQSDVCAASKMSYLSQQQPPAHTPQDTSLVPPYVLAVVSKHNAPGGTLGPVPPHTTALGFEMHIDTLPGARPKAARQYRITPIEQAELEKQVQHLIHMGWIKPSVSPWVYCLHPNLAVNFGCVLTGGISMKTPLRKPTPSLAFTPYLTNCKVAKSSLPKT